VIDVQATGGVSRLRMTPDLVKAGFVELRPETVPARIVLSTASGEKCGKTHFAFTAPGPISVVSADTGTKEVMRKFLRQKSMAFCQVVAASDILEAEGAGGAKSAGRKQWDKAKTAVRRARDERQFRTVVMDTASELWELCRLASFGKLTQVMPHHYGEVNQEFRVFIKDLFERPDLNVVLIHKVKKEYKENKKGDSNWTGNWERAGMGDVPYLVDINAEHYKIATPEEELKCRFALRVLDSRLEPFSTIGLELEGEECTFAHLGVLACPDTDFEYWG
jgi:hypothetical protein